MRYRLGERVFLIGIYDECLLQKDEGTIVEIDNFAGSLVYKIIIDGKDCWLGPSQILSKRYMELIFDDLNSI